MCNDSFELFSKKLGRTFKLQKDFLLTKMKHEEVFADTWRGKKDE